MAVDGSLVFDTRIDSDGFNQGTKQLSTSLTRLKSTLGKVGVAVAAAFSIKKIVDFGKRAIETASDLQEVQNVVDTAFGDMSYKMEEFANTSVEQFGISKLAAKQTGSTFMAMSVGMGIARDAASDMSVALTGLSADMASFYNVEQDVAATALKSVFTGETETLKQFGVVMTEANLEAYALSKGITKSLSSMTQAEKVQLRYRYVLSQTALAQGDFAKTSDSWANQTRILSEKWKEFSSTVGTVLMRVVLPAVQILNRALTNLNSYAQAAAKTLADLFGWETNISASAGQLASETENSANNYSAMAAAAEETNQASEKSLASFDQLNKLSGNSSDDSPVDFADVPVGITVTNQEDAIGQAEGLVEKFQNIFSKISDIISSAFDFSTVIENCKKGFQNLKKFFGGIFKVLGESTQGMRETVTNAFYHMFAGVSQYASSITTIVSDMFSKWTENAAQWVEDNQEKIKAVFDSFQQIMADIMNLFGSIFSDIGRSLTEWWNNGFAPVYDKLCQAFWDIAGILMDVWNNYIYPVVDTVISELQRLWDQHLKPLWDDVLSFVTSVGNFVMMLWEKFLKPFIDKLVVQWGPLFKNVFSNVAKFVGDAIGVVVDAIRNIINTLKNVLNFITSVFQGNWKDAWESIKKYFADSWNGLWNIVKGVINLIVDAINALWSGLYNSLRNVINGVGDIVSKIGGALGQDWGFSVPDTPPMIPRLATGAVIPPNQEFLAVLGDQKRGTNIEAPLETIVEAMMIALGKADIGGETVVRFEGNLAQLARVLNPVIQKEQRRASVFHG